MEQTTSELKHTCLSEKEALTDIDYEQHEYPGKPKKLKYISIQNH